MKKLALSLRGGMFKCFCYLGVIQALEDNKIPIDAILGTSGGAFIGGLYCGGLTVEQILNYQNEFSFRKFIGLESFKNFSFVSSGKMEAALRKHLPIKIIEKTKIKFISAVTDLQETKPFYIQEGDLPKAITASCSYPIFVSPVKINGKYYADGAFSCGYSAEFLRSLGYDVVVGATIGGHRYKIPAGMGIIERFPEHIRILTQQLEELEQKIDPVDVLIDGLAVGFKRSNIKSAQELYNKGYEITSTKISTIKSLLD